VAVILGLRKLKLLGKFKFTNYQEIYQTRHNKIEDTKKKRTPNQGIIEENKLMVLTE
jgi:hypothetical protein